MKAPKGMKILRGVETLGGVEAAETMGKRKRREIRRGDTKRCEQQQAWRRQEARTPTGAETENIRN